MAGVMKGAVAHLAGVGRFDFEVESLLNSHGLTVRKNLLTDALEIHGDADRSVLTDERLAEIRFSLCYAKNGQDPAKDKVADALALIGERRAYHPVRDYLAGLEWDGEERLDAWLCRYAGAEDTPLNRAYGRKILCAAVRRVRRPGCKFDYIAVLQGRQGALKSSLVKALSPEEEWFTDQLKVGAEAKETIERTRGAWIVELAELDGMNRREANAVKSFATTTVDRARMSYGRYVVDRPRHFVLFGTTNEAKFLTDTTGNRRWWIIPVSVCDVAGLEAVRDQLWAEAVAAEPTEPLWLDGEELQAAHVATVEAVQDAGPWLELLEGRIPVGPLLVRPVDAWALVGIKRDDIHKATRQTRELLKQALVGLGFEPQSKTVRMPGGSSDRFYVRGDAQLARMWSPDDGIASHDDGPF